MNIQLIWILFLGSAIIGAVETIPTKTVNCLECHANTPLIRCSEKNHAYCESCIEQKAYQQMEKNDGQFGRKLACPAKDCPYWIHEQQVRRCLPFRATIDRQQKLKENQRKCLERDCECCYTNTAAIICTDGHAVCSTCLEYESKEQLAGNRETVTRVPHLGCPASGCRLKLPESLVKDGMTKVAYKTRSRILQQQLDATRPDTCKFCSKKGRFVRNLDSRFLCDLLQCENPKCGATYCAECEQRTTTNHVCKDKEKYQNWRALLKLGTPCPGCHQFAQKTNGCQRIKCKCGAPFCYACGEEWSFFSTHHCNNCLGRN